MDSLIHKIRGNAIKEVWYYGFREQLDMATLCEALKVNTSVNHLNLIHHTLTVDDFKRLLEMFAVNVCIGELTLESIRVDAECAALLAEVLKVNRSLYRLKLGNFGMDDAGVRSITDRLKDSTLTAFHLEDERQLFSVEMYKGLADALEVNRSLDHLILYDTRGISADRIQPLLNSLKVNRTITKLHLGMLEWSHEMCQQLAEMIKVTHTLSYLYTWFRLTGEAYYSVGRYTLDDDRLMVEAMRLNPALTEWEDPYDNVQLVAEFTCRNTHNLAQKAATLKGLLKS